MLNGKLENDLVSDCAYLFLISLFVYSFVRMKLFLFLLCVCARVCHSVAFESMHTCI